MPVSLAAPYKEIIVSDVPLLAVAELLSNSGAVVGVWTRQHGLVSYDGNLKAIVGQEDLSLIHSPLRLLKRFVRPDHHKTLEHKLTELGEGRIAGIDLTFSTTSIKASSLRLRAKWSGDKVVFFIEDASSYFDSMTGLPNRTYITRHLPDLLNESVKNGYGLAVLYADLQNFKRFNDTHRHEAGNQLISAFAERLLTVTSQFCLSGDHINDAVCPGHIVARQHGDEFLVLLTGLPSEEKATEIAERIAAEVNGAPYKLEVPVTARADTYEVLASIGLAYADAPFSNPVDLLDRADAAMFAAKLDVGFGPSNFAVYTPAIQESMMREEWQRQALGEAIRSHTYDLVFQPFVDIRKDRRGQIVGAEVLLRPNGSWQPDSLEHEFRVIDGFKLTPELMAPTLIQVCELIEDRIRVGQPGFVVSVNISAEQITKRDHFDKLIDLLRNYPVASTWLILEITERTKMHATAEISRRLESLVELGLMLALDDFGTEYANADIVFELGYLLSFVKIAGMYVKAIGDPEVEKRAAIFITHLTALARKISINVIYEGIETEFQANAISAAVIDQEDDDERKYPHHYAFAQGHYYSVPLSWQDLTAVIDSSAKLL